ncbi:MAG: PAS domain S-box protein [Smithella sp.]|jgi:PAS domain S-box-containing protein|nr:PAS domain S-box protein [Smithella sp.]
MAIPLFEKNRTMLFIAVMLFATVSLLVIVIGFLLYQSQKKDIKNAAGQQLTAIADLKVREIESWRKERISDANLIYNNKTFSAGVNQYFNRPSSSSGSQQSILSVLKAMHESNQNKNVLLVDKNKKVKWAAEAPSVDFSDIHSLVIEEALTKKIIILSDFYIDKKTNDAHLTMSIPVLFAQSGNESAIGVVVIVIDPELHLYPTIKTWPIPNSSGETLIIHREDDEVVYLNQLRNAANKPMMMRRSVHEYKLPTALAVLGVKGIVDGIDYRREKVLASIKKVPDSRWYLIAKIDEKEIYAPIAQRFWIIAFFVITIIIICGAVIAHIWRYQESKHYRLQVEREDKRKSLYARSLIEASLDPLVTINIDGQIMDVNSSTELVTGLSRGKLIGSDFSNYFTQPEKAEQGYQLVFKNGVIRDYPLAIKSVSGQITEVLYNASVYKDDSGAVQGIFAAARDVTELRRTQKELKKAHDELELRVHERTNQLQRTNEALEAEIRERKEAEKLIELRTRLLEATNKELESFGYSISHDLRAPLRAIDGYSRMILRDQLDRLDSEGKRKLELIRSNTQMMGRLIDDLLAFSRLVRLEIIKSRLDMDGLINDTWNELQIINPGRNLSFIVEKVPAGWGDRTLIKQVYSNLLSNAIKYTKTKTEARIETGGYTDGDDNIYYVKDNGVGFDMEYYDKLFGVFHRLHSSDDYEGTGVGLAIVQRIIHRHGGRVWAEGKVDEGAVFYFTLQREDGLT